MPTSPPSSLPSHASFYLIFHFLYAYAFLSSRPWKVYFKIDHNASPRDDLNKYGPSAIQKGKLTQKQLDQLRRVESCHANSVEHFALFATAIVLAQTAGLHGVVNNLGLQYTVARVLYAIAYIFNERNQVIALARGVCWWSSSILCLRVIWLAGNAFNGKR